MSEQTNDPTSEPTLGLLVRNAATTFDVVGHARGRRLPAGARLRGPRLGTPEGASLPVGTVELVARLLDRDGEVVDTFAWSADSRDFHDYRDEAGDLRGFSIRTVDQPRSFCVPVRPGVEYLVVSRAELGGAGAVHETPIKAIRLVGGTPGSGGLVFPTLALMELDFLEHVPYLGPVSIPLPNGYIDRVEALHAESRPFDIVITGDGFAAADIAAFVSEADVIIAGMRDMEPFKTFDNLINYHKVVAVSDDSGITDPITAGVEKDTYYHVTTGFNGYNSDAVIGTPFPELVRDATSKVRPWPEIDVVIVIANHQVYGGYAMRSEGMAFVCRAAATTDQIFAHLAAHESAHVVAKLADEYITCEAYDASESFPNLATAEQVKTGDVPWKRLAGDSGELNVDGTLRLVHEFHLNCSSDGDVNSGILPSSALDRIGAFWGCMYTDPSDAPENCSVFQDPRGTGFYRPMSRCVMRATQREFCRVCRHEYGEAILGTARILFRVPHKFPDRPPFDRPTPADQRIRRPPIAARPPQVEG